jgi:hypothetical protein
MWSTWPPRKGKLTVKAMVGELADKDVLLSRSSRGAGDGDLNPFEEAKIISELHTDMASLSRRSRCGQIECIHDRKQDQAPRTSRSVLD